MKLAMIQGDTKAFTFTLYEDDETTPIDLETDADEITFTARKYQHSDDIVKTLGDGIELVEQGEEEDAPDVTGQITVTLDPEDTSEIDVPDYLARLTLLWDIEVVTDGAVHTRRRGELVLYPQVTEDEAS